MSFKIANSETVHIAMVDSQETWDKVQRTGRNLMLCQCLKMGKLEDLGNDSPIGPSEWHARAAVKASSMTLQT